MIYLLYLFIIFASVCTTYGMDTNDWRNQREFVLADDDDSSYASDCNPYLLDQYDQDNINRTVPWKILLSQYDIFDHSAVKRVIVLKTIKDLDTLYPSLVAPFRSESEPDLATRVLIQLIQDICKNEPEHDAETVSSDNGRALFIGRRKSVPYSFKPEYNTRTNSTTSTNSSN